MSNPRQQAEQFENCPHWRAYARSQIVASLMRRCGGGPATEDLAGGLFGSPASLARLRELFPPLERKKVKNVFDLPGLRMATLHAKPRRVGYDPDQVKRFQALRDRRKAIGVS